MTPAQALVALIGWALIVTAGYHVGKYKGRQTAGLTLTILLGLVGLLILACLPKTQAVKMAEAQRQYELQAEAARRAGFPYPPPFPYPYPPQGPYAVPGPYPPQGPYAAPGPYP